MSIPLNPFLSEHFFTLYIGPVGRTICVPEVSAERAIYAQRHKQIHNPFASCCISVVREVILGLGFSLDDYIAPDSAVNFLFTPKDHSLASFFSTIDAAIMGRKALNAARKMGGQSSGNSLKIKSSSTFKSGQNDKLTFHILMPFRQGQSAKRSATPRPQNPSNTQMK